MFQIFAASFVSYVGAEEDRPLYASAAFPAPIPVWEQHPNLFSQRIVSKQLRTVNLLTSGEKR